MKLEAIDKKLLTIGAVTNLVAALIVVYFFMKGVVRSVER